MCGRKRVTLTPDQVLHTAGARQWVDRESYQPSYNASPSFAAPVVRTDGSDHEPIVHTMRWGLVPRYTKPEEKPDFWRMFNARSETVAEKASFRHLVPSRRCLVLAEGFYEWQKEKSGVKQPYYIHLASEEPLVMAGLWDVWESAEGPVHTYTILTTDSSKRLEWLHDRMPVILRTPEAQQAWLRTDNKATLGTLYKLYVPYNGEDLVWCQVTHQMNTPAFQGSECCKEVKKPSVASFFMPRSAKEADGSPAAAATAGLQSVKEEAALVGEQQKVQVEGAAVVRAEPEVQLVRGQQQDGAAAEATEAAFTVKQEPGEQQHWQQEQQQAEGTEEKQAGQPGDGAAEEPADQQAAAPAATAVEQASEASKTGNPSQHQVTPQKRKAPGSGGGKSSSAGKGSRAGRCGGISKSKKAKLPGQLNITKFLKK